MFPYQSMDMCAIPTIALTSALCRMDTSIPSKSLKVCVDLFIPVSQPKQLDQRLNQRVPAINQDVLFLNRYKKYKVIQCDMSTYISYANSLTNTWQSNLKKNFHNNFWSFNALSN